MKEIEHNTNINNWGHLSLQTEGEIKHIRLGDLSLWLQRKDDEVWISHVHQIDSELQGKPTDTPPEDLLWSRWALKEMEDSVRLLPAFPDLPLMVNSEYPLLVIPGGSIQIFTRIPVWLSISIGSKAKVLSEFPTVKLSRTWFGTPMEGELCYWSTTKARRSLKNVEKKPYLVSCPIQIINKSGEDLDFEKFCFRVERLKIFSYQDELWADETRIVYQGEDQHSDISMSGRLPKEMDSAELINPPRKPMQRSLATRTFRKIFDDSFLFGR